MRYFKAICCALVCLCLSVASVGAQTDHFFYGSVGLGYSTLKYHTEQLQTIGNGGATLGIGYEFQTSGGFVLSLGAAYDAINSTTRHKPFVNDRLMVDTDGLPDGTPWYDTVMFHTAFNRFRETQMLGFVSIPLLFGARFDRFTILAGGKVAFPLYARFDTKSHITTTGTYQWFDEDFHDMENHYYVGDKRLKNSGTLQTSMNIDVVVQAYVDCTPSRWKSTQLHLGAFVDYGVLNISQETQTQPLITYHDDPLDITFVSQLQSNALNKKNISPLMVGISAKFLFELGTTSGGGGRTHRHCNCINGFNHKGWGRY